MAQSKALWLFHRLSLRRLYICFILLWSARLGHSTFKGHRYTQDHANMNACERERGRDRSMIDRKKDR
jgi:hypothetical protein